MPAKAVKISVTVDEGVLARIDRAASEAGTNRSAFLTDSALRHLRGLQPERAEAANRSFSASPAAFSGREETVEVPTALFDFLAELILKRCKRSKRIALEQTRVGPFSESRARGACECAGRASQRPAVQEIVSGNTLR